MRGLAARILVGVIALSGCATTDDAATDEPAPQPAETSASPTASETPQDTPAPTPSAEDSEPAAAIPGMLSALQACDVFNRGIRNSARDGMPWPDGLTLATEATDTNPVFTPLVEAIQGYRDAAAMFHNPAKRTWSTNMVDLCAEVSLAADRQGVAIESPSSSTLLTDLKVFIVGNIRQQQDPSPERLCSVYEQIPDEMVESFVSGFMGSTNPQEPQEPWMPSEHELRLVAAEAHVEACREHIDAAEAVPEFGGGRTQAVSDTES